MYKNSDRKRDSSKWRKGGDSKEDRRKMPRHPPHLRGKQIGLYYAQLSSQRKKAENQAARVIGEILLPESKKQDLEQVLQSTENYTYNKNTIFKKKFEKFVEGKSEKNVSTETFKQNALLDEKLKQEFELRKTTPEYQNILRKRKSLPSYKLKDDITHAIETNQVVVISGETGCGKTTQVAQFILDDYVEQGKGSLCRIICTQPRRISAISIAERVADERTEKLGEGVGYQIRLEKVLPRERASILYCTTGVILRQMESNPYLSEASHLIFDEIHERDVNSDLLLTLFKQILKKRPSLKVVLMSATLNAEKFSEYFGNCPHLNIPGFTYPVQEFYLEDVLQRTGFVIKNFSNRKRRREEEVEFYSDFMEPYVRQLKANKTCSNKVCDMLLNSQLEEMINLDLILSLIINICETEEDQGAILVFLTGWIEISELNKMMEKSRKFPASDFLIVPLHSQMPTVNQKQVFEKPPRGIRKIVLSTNIAETSITIDDVVFVIDCGKIKMTNYDAEFDRYTLKPQWVALANASQRKGRAGRVQPGVCFHLFSRPRKLVLEQYQKAEVLRTRLENTILQIKVLQLGKCADFLSKLMEPPSDDVIKVSVNLLKRMNALDDDECLTPLGYHLTKLPIAPQMGKMIVLGAIFSCLDPILSVAASLDFKDPFVTPLGKERQVDNCRRELANGLMSDHLMVCNVLHQFESLNYYSSRQFCSKYFLSTNTLHQLQKMKSQFMDYLYETEFVDSKDHKDAKFNTNSNNTILIKAIICAGLYPNVITASGKKSRILRTIENQKVVFHPKSILSKESYFPSPLFVYYLKLTSTSTFIHDATVVYPLPLVFFGDKYEYDLENSIIRLADRQLCFKSSESSNDIIRRLRDKLNWFLEYKISNPGVIDWTSDKQENVVLRAVMDLITNEELGLLDLDYDDFDNT